MTQSRQAVPAALAIAFVMVVSAFGWANPPSEEKPIIVARTAQRDTPASEPVTQIRLNSLPPLPYVLGLAEANG